MLVAICVCGFKKNAPAMSVKLRLCLWVQKNAPATMLVAFRVRRFKKMHPQQCRLLLVSAGSKKCTRDVVGRSLCLWVQKSAPAMSVKLRLCLRVQKNKPAMSVKLRLCLWVQKNAPATMLVAICVCWFKKNVPVMSVKSRLCLWVQKNVPTDRTEWLCVKCCHDMLLAA